MDRGEGGGKSLSYKKGVILTFLRQKTKNGISNAKEKGGGSKIAIAFLAVLFGRKGKKKRDRGTLAKKKGGKRRPSSEEEARVPLEKRKEKSFFQERNGPLRGRVGGGKKRGKKEN